MLDEWAIGRKALKTCFVLYSCLQIPSYLSLAFAEDFKSWGGDQQADVMGLPKTWVYLQLLLIWWWSGGVGGDERDRDSEYFYAKIDTGKWQQEDTKNQNTLQLLPSAVFHLVSNISSQNIHLISNKNKMSLLNTCILINYLLIWFNYFIRYNINEKEY